ncbi:hypothetical protein J6TS2_08740 [Heyndrickxia sporothermodurans]|nr:hypothetical protein J6TS2_08740 [Heyndrickxia sporothermodurans]
MHKRIVDELKKIERAYNVKVLYACDSGSRSWELSSIDSDYDVRFIYLHSKEWYLSIDQKRDVIELPIDDVLDMNGWDLQKALRLFRKSNPSILEWLSSGIIYYQSYSVIMQLKKLTSTVFDPKACFYHYLHMAKKNIRDFLHKDQLKIKKYFYILRPILAAKWIEQNHCFPPVEFTVLVNELLPEGELKKEIVKLRDLKINGIELDIIVNINLIKEFIQLEVEKLSQYTTSLNKNNLDPTEQLNELFRNALKEAWR